MNAGVESPFWVTAIEMCYLQPGVAERNTSGYGYFRGSKKVERWTLGEGGGGDWYEPGSL